jgi:hypothetical protein
MKLGKIFFASCLLLNTCAYSQSRPAGPIIVSPNAASLVEYAETPVSYFTGLPAIEIPVYTIKEKEISFPISLNYHAQGFKPDVHPSWVGANWSVNFGGVITRKMNKLPDEWRSDDYFTYGFYYTYNRLNNFNWSSNDTLLSLGNNSNTGLVQMDRTDREPDEFNFNFLGYSGKFFLDHLGKWRVQCNKNIRVVFDNGDLIDPFFHNSIPSSASLLAFKPKVFGKFTLIDDAGIKYVFGKTDGTDGIEYSSSISPPGFNYRVWLLATSWYLAEIKFPRTGAIKIFYERGPFQSNFQYFESQNRFYVSRCDQPSAIDAKGLSGTICSPVYPYLITASNGISIDLKYSKSNELAYPSSTYFEPFRDEQGRLPSQQSPPQGIDGFYFAFMNARNSVPYYVANAIYSDGIINNSKFVWFKLDSIIVSTPDLNNNMVKTAFKRVQFNYRENIYERLKLLSINIRGNTESSQSQDYLFKYNDYGSAAPGYVSSLTDHWGFAINKPLKRDPVYGGYSWFGGSMLSNREPDELPAKIDILTDITYPTGGKSSFEYEGNDYGKYLQNTTRYYAPAGYGKAGGLRIKKIINNDGLGNIETKEFFYVTGYDPLVPITSLSSSGVLDGKPAFTHYNYSVSMNGMYLSLFSSNGIVPMSANSGALCGYSEVAEKFRDGSYKIYRFTNHDNGYNDYDALSTITPYQLGVPYRSRSFERGLLLSEDIYTAGRNLLQRTEYSYVRIGSGADSNFVRSLRKDFGGYCTTLSIINPYSGSASIGFQVPMMNGYYINPASFVPTYTTATAYGYYTYKFLPEKTTRKLYPSGGLSNQLLVTETTNQYDQFGNIVQTNQNDSKGNVVISKFKYPYYFAGTAVYDSMISRGITGPVIETEDYLGATLTRKEKINYGFFNGVALIKPVSTSRQVSGNAPYLTTQFNRYDEYGNILELQGIEGLKTSFIWSYFKSRVVAKVTGSSYSAIDAIVNPQLLTYPPLGDQQLLTEVDKLRTQLPNTFVTTYLYEPKAGLELKQIKDANGLNAYYEYDAMGRLARTRDNNNKIITQLEYSLKDVVSFPYRNAERSALFNRTDCPYGYTGSALYVVPPNKYGSFINQADADQKADNEINVNGQNYANSTATCYPYWSYTSCCGFTSFTSTFTLTGSNSVAVSLVIQKSQPGGGAGVQIGTLSGPLFLPSVNRSIYYNSAGYSGMIQITPIGQVKLYGSYGSMPIQISGTYSL